MEKNLTVFDRVVRLLLAAILAFAALFLFKHPIGQILGGLAALFALGEAVIGTCYLQARLGSTRRGEALTERAVYLVGLVGIQVVLAYEWWSAGWEKISGGEFVDGIAGTLGYFASENPFPWYKDFLLGFATRNATAFAYTVESAQVMIAIVLAVAGVAYLYSRNTNVQRVALTASLIALLGGILMNANFYLAAGWTGPGTHGINVVMFWIQAMLGYVWMYRLSHHGHGN